MSQTAWIFQNIRSASWGLSIILKTRTGALLMNFFAFLRAHDVKFARKGALLAHIILELQDNAKKRSKNGRLFDATYLYSSIDAQGRTSYVLRFTSLQDGLGREKYWDMLKKNAEEVERSGTRFLRDRYFTWKGGIKLSPVSAAAWPRSAG